MERGNLCADVKGAIRMEEPGESEYRSST
jgi:hypothetical protein